MILKKIEEKIEKKISQVTGLSQPPKTAAYSDIGGLEKEVARVREMVEFPLPNPKIFEQLGIDAPKGVLLYGQPGCGKTLIARAVAQETGVHFINVNSAEIIKSSYGQSEQQLRDIFEEAERYPAAIIFIDEIDAIVPKRKNDDSAGHVTERMVGQFLIEMDNLKHQDVLVIAATNRPDLIDNALLRPGRFDYIVELPMPDFEARCDILKIFTKEKPLSNDINIETLAQKTDGFSGAELEALCQMATVSALKESVENNTNTEELRIENKHFEMGFKNFKK